MDTSPRRARRARLHTLRGVISIAAVLPVILPIAKAQTLYWDGDGTGATGNPPASGVGGTGIWNSTNLFWWTGTAHQAWAPNALADFRGSGGTITVSEAVAANRLSFNGVSTTWRFENSGTGLLTLNNTGTPNLVLTNAFNGSNKVFLRGNLAGSIYLGGSNSSALTTANWVGVSGTNTGVTSTVIGDGTTAHRIAAGSASALGGNSATVQIAANSSLWLEIETASTGITFNSWATTLAEGSSIRVRNGGNLAPGTPLAAATSTYSGNLTLTGNAGISVRGTAGNGLNLTGSIDLSDKTLTLNPGSTTSPSPVGTVIDVQGSISGSGSVSLAAVNSSIDAAGSGALSSVRLSADNGFSGSVTATQNGPSLSLNHVNALKNATLNTGSAAGTQSVSFAVAGSNTYNIGALQGSDPLAIGSNTISVGNKAANTSFDAAISGTDGSLVKVGSSNALTLTAANTYTGATQITGGKLALTGSGAINSSSGITVNGSGATFVQAASTAVSPTVTLTQGTVTGSGTINTVNVGAGTGGILSNNDGVAGAALTINSLTLAGGAAIQLFSNGSNTSAPLVVGSFTNNAAASAVTLTANNPAGWFSGNTYNLISYTSLGGSGGNNFAQAVNNLTTRQSGIWGDTGSAITLTINGNNPYWTGGSNGNWNTTQTGNWKLSTGNADTEFIAADEVIFNDNATGTTTLDIDAANVATTSITFNNSALDYTIGSTGGFGITSGSVTKSGSGNVTLNTSNSYAGTTTVNAGNLTLGNANTASGTTTVNGGSLTLAHASALAGSTLNTSGSGSVVFSAPGNVTYALGGLQGSNDLTVGTNSLSVGANGESTTFSGSLGMQGSLTKVGAGTLTLAGASSHTGSTSVNAGTLRIGSAANVLHSTSTVTLANTAGVTLDLNGNSQSVGALAGGGTTGGTVALGTGNLTIGASSNQTYNGKFSGSGDIIVNAASPSGTVSLAGDGHGEVHGVSPETCACKRAC
jgi:autotransporter-associated beta strand protein